MKGVHSKKTDVLEMPLGKFAGIKPSSRPYFFIRGICGLENRRDGGDNIFVKDIINIQPKYIKSFISEEIPHADFRRSFLKTLNLVRNKLIEAGFSKKLNFLRTPYFVTASSPDNDWQTVWIEMYGLTNTESKKLSNLLRKVKYSVSQY